MVRQTWSGTLKFADFLEQVREDQKADLIDGVIRLASPENWEHNQLKLWLSTVLGLYIRRRGLGALAADRFAFRLSDETAPEPDLAFVSKERLHLIRAREGYLDGPPDLAVEIISPDSIKRDYEVKHRRYEEAGLREYWIIDPMEQTATFLVLSEAGFVEVFPEDHVFRSRVLPGLDLDIRWLWKHPLPDAMSVVQRLLSA